MPNKSLYVGNLPYSATEATLMDLFAPFGATSARIIEGRGFGFVDVDAEQVEEAISARHNFQLEGRALTVNVARPKPENGPRRSGGGKRRH